MANDKVQLFEDQPIRTAWVEDEEEWYFSVVDVVQALTESADVRKYWNKLKQRLKEEGGQLVTNCHQLKMRSPKDGKRYITDVANTEQCSFEKMYKGSDTLRMVRTNIVRNGVRLILEKSKMTLGGAVLLRKMRREITPG